MLTIVDTTRVGAGAFKTEDLGEYCHPTHYQIWQRSRLTMCATGSERNSRRLAENGEHPQAEDVAVAGKSPCLDNFGCTANSLGSVCQHFELFLISKLAFTYSDFIDLVVVKHGHMINYYTSLNLTKVSLAKTTPMGLEKLTLHAARCT